MFGIGLPEMIVILAVALIVVGPEKLPELARSLAKGVVDLKRTMNQLKHSLSDDNELTSIQKDLQDSAKELKDSLISPDFEEFKREVPGDENRSPDSEPVETETGDKERPWEADRKKTPVPDSYDNTREETPQEAEQSDNTNDSSST